MSKTLSRHWTCGLPATAGLLALAAAAQAVDPPLYWTSPTALSGVAVRQGYHIEWQRTAEEGAPGQMIISWSDTRFGMRDLFAQKIDASQPNAPALWSTVDEHGTVDALVVNDDVIRQEDPVLISDGNGGAVVSWIDFRDDPRGDIYVNRLVDGAGSGALAWGESGVVLCTECANGSENMPKSQCIDGSGGSWVAWSDHRNSTWDLYISRVTAAGTVPAVFGANGLPIVTEPGDQQAMSMEHDGQGGAFLVWIDKRDAADEDIYIEHVNADGTLVAGGGGRLVAGAAGSQQSVKVTWDGGTGCFVSWMDLRADNSGDIYLQHFNAALTPTFAADGIAIAAQVGNIETNPRLSYAGDGTTLLMWEDNRNDATNTQADVFCQKVSSSNTAIWGAGGVPVTLAAGHQQQARVLGDGAGGAFFVWQDARDEDYAAIYAQKLNASGVRQWGENGTAVVDRTDIESDAIAPSLRSDQQGGLFVAWGDLSRGSLGIFTQHLNASGQRSFPAEGHDSVWGISGSCTRVRNVATGDGTLVFWTDPRNAGGPHVYMQNLARGTGERRLPENGLPVALALEGGQKSYQVAPDGQGGAYVLIEVGSELGQRAWLTRVSASGSPVWGEPKPVTVGFNSGSGLEYQERTRLLVVGDRIYAAWSGVDTDYSMFTAETMMQAFDLQGNQLWGDDGLRLSYTSNIHEKLTDLVAGPDGGVYVLWDAGNWQDTNCLMQRVDSQGQIQLAQGGVPFANGTGKQERAVGAAGADGTLIGVWQDYAQETSDSDLIARAVNADGSTRWTTEIDMRPLSQASPAIVPDGQGGAFIGYTDFSNAANNDVYAAHLLSDGSMAWTGTETNVFVGNGAQEDVALCRVPRGGWNGLILALAAEETDDTTGYKDLWARDSHVDPADGDVDTTNYAGLLFHFFHTQREPWLSHDLADGVYLSWIDMRASGKEDLNDVYTQRLATGDTDVDDPVVRGFQLAQNTPNPFNPSTEIAFQTLRQSSVKLEVFDIQGRLVRTLQDGPLASGTHRRVFDGRGEDGVQLASGVYIYRLSADGRQEARRMLLVK